MTNGCGTGFFSNIVKYFYTLFSKDAVKIKTPPALVAAAAAAPASPKNERKTLFHVSKNFST
ncbi:CLUMA_CG005187, isoform A [Clunio marinus]|uniref:CLUMA_CG005187, isoform A n=1 Tax=Clunio marinus TaxID=568069 RepID=A0A1J1HYB2_9DIPT|nr:CLUMA_CG005187, isoform A [Clunio marinus]